MNFLWMTPTEKGTWVMKRVIKTLELFQEFDMDPSSEDAWMHLAIALAERYKPGFGPPRKRGRRREHIDDDNSLDADGRVVEAPGRLLGPRSLRGHRSGWDY
jgi:hypothetical protein